MLSAGETGTLNTHRRFGASLRTSRCMAFILSGKKVQTVWVWLIKDGSKPSQKPLINDLVIVSMVFFSV